MYDDVIIFVRLCTHYDKNKRKHTHTEGQGERDIDRRVDGQELTAIISHYTGLCNEVKCANNAIKCSLLFCIQKKCFRIGILTHTHVHVYNTYIIERKVHWLAKKASRRSLKLLFTFCVLQDSMKKKHNGLACLPTHTYRRKIERKLQSIRKDERNHENSSKYMDGHKLLCSNSLSEWLSHSIHYTISNRSFEIQSTIERTAPPSPPPPSASSSLSVHFASRPLSLCFFQHLAIFIIEMKTHIYTPDC